MFGELNRINIFCFSSSLYRVHTTCKTLYYLYFIGYLKILIAHDFMSLKELRWSMLFYVHLCWFLLIYVDLCWFMLIYVDLCLSMLIYVVLYRPIFIYIDICDLCWSIINISEISLCRSSRDLHVLLRYYLIFNSTLF